MAKETLELLVEGGKASPGPATAPKLSQYKLNIGQVFADINEKTKEYAGMDVPVKLIIDKKTKKYKIKIGTPPVSSLIKKELGLKQIGTQEQPEETEPEEKAESEAETEKEGESKEEPEQKKEETEKEKKEPEDKEEKPEKKVEEKTPEKQEPRTMEIVGNLTIDQIIKITKMKRDDLLAKTMKKAVKEVVASVVSMPLKVEGKNPKKVLKDIDNGKYDHKLKD